MNRNLLQLIFILLGLIPVTSYATHARGGDITYEHVSGLTYRFKITTCTNIGGSAQADRSELYINFGDGSGDTIQRVLPVTAIPGYPNYQTNIYIGLHTFVTAGTYIISTEDPNRNAGILNIYPGGSPSSDQVIFAIKTELIINPFLGENGANNSVQFDNCPCPAIACVNYEYCYNPQAVDPDGDSLSYELVAPLGQNGEGLLIPTAYTFPNNYGSGGGTMTINQASGTVCWNKPVVQGDFNFTIKIIEWRNGFEVGYVYRDIQLSVENNCSNVPPEIDPIPDICVVAGETVQFTATANDQNLGDFITLTASSSTFSTAVNPATFTVLGNNPSVGTFVWNTDCSHIIAGNYHVLLAAEDNGSPQFTNYKQVTIKVTPPKLLNVNAVAFGNGVTVSWNAATCSNAEGYRIYRTTNPNFNMPDCCDNPSPEAEGFVKVGENFGINNTSFFDNTSLTLGIDYCYVITAFYNYGQVESCPSDSSCARLKKEVPILTHVTVNSTDASLGVDSIIWSKPTELDTAIYPGPYFYKIYHGNTIGSINTLLGQTSTALFLGNTDTAYTHNNINTLDITNYYRVELFYNHLGSDSLVGSSNAGGSIYVTTIPNDNQITLNWAENVPWINTSYEIFKGSTIGGSYVSIGTTTAQTFTDTGLNNGETYCYYVKSTGHYSSPSIINPIVNLSQEVCAKPIDLTPPCPPVLTIEGDCEIGINKLIWSNPNNDCADDVMSYSVYYTAVEGDTLKLIATINTLNDTVFYHSNNGSVAGCYAVTATDSIIYNNESVFSDIVCFDNCPIYFLPNVFSPNDDGKNEYFTPLTPYKYIKDIDFNIYNRWGQIVFTTTDPAILWDGVHKDSGEPVPGGVYYYEGTVNTIRLSGIEPTQISGFFHLFREGKKE